MLADEEPKYLRRQRPLEIRRRKFGRKAWKSYLRVAMWTAVGLAGAWAVFECGQFLLASPAMALVHPDQVNISGTHFTPRRSILEIFAADRGKSILRVPIEERRQEIESIPWVQSAVVRRVLPNRIAVSITERTPIAFLREGSSMALVDVHGVILDRSVEGNFDFPVVTGVNSELPLEDRAQRMQLFSGFMQQIESAGRNAANRISEVDLSDLEDVQATVTGLGGASASGGADDSSAQVAAPILVHFGGGDFASKYQTLVQDIAQWRAKAGSVQSVDLRFNGEAVVNPEAPVAVAQQAKNFGAVRAIRHSR
ncbi:MAG TPA: FtsQ-type POTRA domain-containing protein [Candidatus Dormibacteraeota bacterium]|nr:FtsQ-type POTRA domain-containing protein [Candidatus Dormibacteraeota bacterium]